MTVRLISGDCREVLRTLPDKSVHCCVTSPPYFGLRDYGTAQWEGGAVDCDHSTPRSRGDDIRAGDKQGTSAGSRPNTQRECKCGATRIDRQMGLEPTPDEFVAGMVEVFREVRRVLRDDGTLWLNIGDSYAASGMGGNPAESEHRKQATNVGSLIAGRRAPAGLKPKDLIGIPWLLAKALRDPYYTGRIKSLEDRIWLAAMIDGEGCMFIHKRKAGDNGYSKYTKRDGTVSSYNRTQDNYGAGLEVANTSKAIVDRCLEITGVGSICRQEKDRRQPLYRWNLRSNECRWVIEEIYPHLVGKQHQARLLLGCPSNGENADLAHRGLIDLHNGLTPAIDFPAPKTLYERGWYLRQDLIWSKSNPMPESVRDRCTKAHEYLFLLSKSPKYHFDAGAIAEPVSPNTHARMAQNVEAQKGSDRVPGKTNGPMKAVLRKVAEPGSGIKGNSSFYEATKGHVTERNKRSVWTVPTQPFSEAHFATFPPELIEPCILAGCPESVCSACGAPWLREVERTPMVLDRSERTHSKGQTRSSGTMLAPPSCITLGFSPSCACNAPKASGTVLDPFGGAGTTGLVADRLQRSAILIELNPEYAAIAERRLHADAGMFAEIAA